MVQLLKCVAQFTGETGLWRFIYRKLEMLESLLSEES